VIDLFRMNGWWVHHDRGEMRKHIQGDVGFPDIFAVHRRRKCAVAAELKMPKGVTSDWQKGWIEILSFLGPHLGTEQERVIDVHLWRPDDWDTIVHVATGR
jgi:hypothetical protein